MSSHVVVIDSSARRATVKVTPGKHLSDVLAEACTKLGLDPNNHGLKHQKKELDLSLSFRLSGLSTGAKLELVQRSRSPAVVSVALQLPENVSKGTVNGRLIDKFPSNTTVWGVLRKFESGIAGGSSERNLTGRAVPNTTVGAGRLFYETPVVNAMGRELCQFTDLQKTLGQLGYNSGSVLLRLSFRVTDTPLEDAMANIETYFKSVEEDMPRSMRPEASPETNGNTPEKAAKDKEAEVSGEQKAQDAQKVQNAQDEEASKEPPAPQQVPSAMPLGTGTDEAATVIQARPTTVFSPPKSSTPQAVQTKYDDNDYIPTIDHAKAHQQHLKATSRPTKLASDAELAAQQEATEAKLAAVQSVEVKVRFPDQSQIVSIFTRGDSCASLHSYVRSCLDPAYAAERFHLTFLPTTTPANGKRQGSPSQAIIPDSSDVMLIRDLRIAGRILVNFSWDQDASQAVQATRSNILKQELRAVAGDIKVKEPEAVPVKEEGPPKRRGAPSTPGSASTSEAKIPKWLKLPGRK